MHQDVDIVGTIPDRGDRIQILLLYANTKTERNLLQGYVDAQIAERPANKNTIVAWFQDDSTQSKFEYEGLLEGLAQSASLDIVPIGVTWKPKSLEKQGWWQMRAWMKLLENEGRQRDVLKKSPDRCAIVVGEFGTKKALQARYNRMATSQGFKPNPDPEAFASFVALQAAITIERDSRTATGQVIKYPRHVHHSIWVRPDFQERLRNIAETTGRTLEDVQKEARECMKELIPRVRAPHVSLSESFFRQVCRLGYDEELVYDKAKMAELRELSLTRPVALVWTHKTHIDGAAMGLTSRQEHFPLVHMIGGDNMAFAGVGYLMRRSGTVFIRRSMSSVVYKAVMRFYLAFLLEKRFPVSWALEGTRSRNGKLMPPRFGILKYIVEAAAKGEMKDLTIVPVSIYYDLIAELGDYAREQSGATKRKESLAWFADYIRSLRKPLGRISLAVGEPVVVDTTDKHLSDAMLDNPEEFSVELQKLAFEASVNVNAVTPVTPSSLICLALTGAAPQALTEEELVEEVTRLRDWAMARDYPMTDELKTGDAEKMREISRSMIEIGVMARYDDGPDTIYSIADGKHFEASYYRNNSIHFFTNQAMIELALLKASYAPSGTALETFWAEIISLRDIFKFEFFYPDMETYRAEIEAEIERHDAGWKSKLAAGQGREILTEMKPLVSHAVLRPFAEAYTIIAEVLRQKPNGPIDEKEVTAEALKLGKQSYLQRKITSEESIGKLMFSNGFQLAKNRGLVPDTELDTKAARNAFARDVTDIAKRLRTVREIAADQRQAMPPDDDRNVLTVVGEN